MMLKFRVLNSFFSICKFNASATAYAKKSAACCLLLNGWDLQNMEGKSIYLSIYGTCSRIIYTNVPHMAGLLDISAAYCIHYLCYLNEGLNVDIHFTLGVYFQAFARSCCSTKKKNKKINIKTIYDCHAPTLCEE